MKIIYIFIIIFILKFLFTFYLKKFWLLRAINTVYIPDFIHSRNEFINDKPLIILKKQRNEIYIVLILWFLVPIILFFKTPFFYVNTLLFILTYIFSILTFNRNIFDNDIFGRFSNYLTK